MQKLPLKFYLQTDTLKIARELLGMVLVTEFDGIRTSGIIVETEAYLGKKDKACHAWNGRKTQRTKTMFLPGGHAYVYLCYGIHHLFNVVTNQEDEPHAILIRAIAPLDGIQHMLKRRRLKVVKRNLTSGPGALSQALGIQTRHSGMALCDSPICIYSQSEKVPKQKIINSPRVGVAYAEADALLPYRFRISDSKWTSLAK